MTLIEEEAFSGIGNCSNIMKIMEGIMVYHCYYNVIYNYVLQCQSQLKSRVICLKIQIIVLLGTFIDVYDIHISH